MFFAGEQRILRRRSDGSFEKAQTQLQTHYSAHGIVDASLRHLTFLHKLFEQGAKFGIVGCHRHIDTGIDGNSNGIFVVYSHFVAIMQIVYISPVGDYHAIPTQLLFEPNGEHLIIGVEGHAIHYSRIHHNRKRSGTNGHLEWLKIFFPQVGGADRCRRAVLATHRIAVSKIMLQARCHILWSQVIRVAALIALDHFHSHYAIDIRVFAETFPDATPRRVATEVHNRTETPWNRTGTRLVGTNCCTLAHQISIERRSHIDFLWKHSASGGVGGAMVLVHSVYYGYSLIFHRLLLNAANHAVPSVNILRRT